MKKEIELCSKYVDEFVLKTKGLTLEPRGMSKSELLLIYSTIKKYNSKVIIESGRARGFSTQVLAKVLDKNYSIVSIDFDKYSQDTKYSEKLLKKYSYVTLIYGDSRKLIPKYIKQNCVVVIDGPKGEDAIILAAKLLMKYPQISALFIHDLTQKVYDREIAKSIFPKILFADNPEFRDKFDMIEVKKTRGCSHIALIHNSKDAVDKKVFKNYMSYYKNRNKALRNKLKNLIVNNGFVYSVYVKILYLLRK